MTNLLLIFMSVKNLKIIGPRYLFMKKISLVKIEPPNSQLKESLDANCANETYDSVLNNEHTHAEFITKYAVSRVL